MKNKVRVWGLIGSLLLLAFTSGCASYKRDKAQKELREAFASGKHEDCLKIIDGVNPGKDEDSKLLYYMERGMIFHDQGKYWLSAQFLEKAREIDRRLFTKSISSAALTYVANDSSDLFYGSSYERSLINYYLALNYFMIFQNGKIESYKKIEADPGGKFNKDEGEKVIAEAMLDGKSKIEYLSKARSQILAWDSMMNTMKGERLGKSVFKEDLLAKILGGFIHEAYRKSSEDEIALQLYKDAKDVLLKHYNAYGTFNKKANEFKNDYSKFASMDIDTVKSRYVDQTLFQQELNDFLSFKILTLTKAVRPSEFDKMVQMYRPSPAVLKMAKEEKGRPNVTIVVENGMIPEKTGKKVAIGFQTVLDNIEDPKTRSQVQVVGSLVLGQFAADILGLGHADGSRSLTGDLAGAAAVNLISIAFELPEIKSTPIARNIMLQIFDSKGNMIKERLMPVLNPINDIAEEAIAEDSTSRYMRTGVRVGLKHLTAILAAYGVYNTLKRANPNTPVYFLKSAALVQYAASSKGIELSEKADNRYWSTLPNEIRSLDFYLDPGTYMLKAKYVTADDKRVETGSFDLGSFQVKAKDQAHLLNFRIKKI